MGVHSLVEIFMCVLAYVGVRDNTKIQCEGAFVPSAHSEERERERERERETPGYVEPV